MLKELNFFISPHFKHLITKGFETLVYSIISKS
nr:MAG TPA: hypothetical protein [Caudoviricetes sp.]